MKKLAMLIVLLPLLAFAQEKRDYVEVTGQAEVRFVPDLIYLRIQVAENDKDLSDLEKKEKEIAARLVRIGIDPAKDLSIKDLASNFRYRAFAKDDIVHSKEYVLLVRSVALANKVIVELEQIKISNVRIDHLDHTKMTDYKRECMVLAMAAAKSKAEALVHSIGQTAGRAIYIEESPARILNFEDNAMRNYAYKAEYQTSEQSYLTNLDFDEIKLEYRILARFELK